MLSRGDRNLCGINKLQGTDNLKASDKNKKSKPGYQ